MNHMLTAQAPAPQGAQDDLDLSLSEQAAVMGLQRSLLEAVALNHHQRDVVDRICRLAEQVLPDTVATVMLLGADGLLSVYAAPSLPRAAVARLDGLKPGPEAGSCGNVVFRAQPVFVSDTLSDGRWLGLRQLAVDLGVRACWSMPVRGSDGAVMGSFALSSFTARAPSAFQRTVLEIGAWTLGIVMERRRQLDALWESEARYRQMFEVNQAIKLVVDPETGGIVDANSAAVTFYGYARVRLLDMSLYDLSALPRDEMAKRLAAAAAGEVLHHVFTQRLASGELREVEVHASPMVERGRVRIYSIIHDITERKRAEEELRLAASVFSSTQEGIVVTDAAGRILDVNPAFSEVTGFAREQVLGANPRLLKSERHDRAFYTALWGTLVRTGRWNGEIWNRRRSGEAYPAWLTISAVRDDKGAVSRYVGVFRDITLIKRQEQALQHLAHFDGLTGLPNRVLLADRMRQAVAGARRRGQMVAVAYLDLDGFKPINDRFGHDVGDQVLVEIAGRIQALLRAEDTVARLGGDEFVVLLPGLDTPDQCQSVLARLLERINRPIATRQSQAVVSVAASIGVSLYPDHGSDPDILLRQADQAMYQAKEAGRGHVQVYDPARDQQEGPRRQMLVRVGRALEQGQLALFYQPKVNMRSGEVLGAEALLRWHCPQRGIVPPGEFLPQIENSELELRLDAWVIEAALNQAEAWRAQGLDLPISVNVNGRQLLHGDFAARLAEMLARHPTLSPERLEIEVLESAALIDLGRALTVIERCRNLGVGFALDDFGTGYSSLAHLRGLPVSSLKIDRSFVDGMLNNPGDLAIIEGVIALADAFGRSVVAEGVESRQHGELLLQLGCELGQGYAIARPMPAESFPEWVATWQPEASWRATEGRRWAASDVGLLVAEFQHRDWINQVVSRIVNRRVGAEQTPALERKDCSFAHWYNGAGRIRYGARPEFAALERAHAEMHALAQELVALADGESKAKASARLSELFAARDEFLSRLTLLQQVVQTPALTAGRRD